ncbi:MAG: hypothetical protein LBS33_04790 [Streptococcaceae bacterium]|jgi:transcriptional regulator of heat shock response|nr:hypothetical protein [Streptococcaceae bacterium]
MYSNVEEAYEELQKEIERQAIKMLLQVKIQQVDEMKQTLQKKLDALEESMYHTTQNDLPADLKEALTGKTSEAVKEFLKNIKKLKPILPVKGY